MRVALLGPLRVVTEDRDVHVGGIRLRALLARLAMDAGRVVASWPESDPEHPRPALQSLVSRLRRALPRPDVLRSEAAGYRLDLPPEAVDTLWFEDLAARGRRDLQAGHRSAAAEHLARALDLWRGVPLATAHFAPLAALPGALFSVWHNVSGAVVASYWARHAPKDTPPEKQEQPAAQP